jgi:PAS domain S-box-containing protein
VVYLYNQNKINEISKQNYKLNEEVKHQTKELSEAKRSIEQIVEFAAIVIITMDEKFQITSWNRQGENLLGFKKDDVIGKNILSNLFVNDEMLMGEFFYQINSEKFIKQIETKMMHFNGQIIEVMLSGSIVYDDHGKNIGYTIIIDDMTDQNKLTNERISKQKILGGLEALNRLLATLSHHVNNSVAAISTVIQLYDESGMFQDKVISITRDHISKIGDVIKSLRILVGTVNLKTKDYAGETNEIFDIENELNQFDEQLKSSQLKKKIM